MNVELISIGDEILSGDILNTNVQFLSRAFWDLGFAVTHHTSVRDNEEDIREALLTAAGRVSIVVCTGGLGPTTDDFTLEVAAKTFGCELIVDVGTLEHLRDFFEKRGRDLTAENRRQALIPEGSLTLPNLLGTAPGVFHDFNGTFLYFLPGVPGEMRQIFLESVLPHVLKYKSSGKKLHKESLRTFGRPESLLQKDLNELFTGQTDIQGVRVGFRPQFPEVLIKLSAWDENPAVAKKRVLDVKRAVMERVGRHVYAEYADTTLEETLVTKLAATSRTVAVAESCTGGRIADRITDVSGSSNVFLGGFVTYSNQQKHDVLGVPAPVLTQFGAVSEECARAMVEGLYQKTGADACVAVTGIAGPTGGSADKPVGTVYIAWHFSDNRGEIRVKKHHFDFERAQFKELVASVAMKGILDHVSSSPSGS